MNPIPKLLFLIGAASIIGQSFAATPVAIADGTLPVVYRNFASMAQKGQPRNNQNLVICLGGTNAFDMFGGWFVGTNTVTSTNTTTRIASLTEAGFSWERMQTEVDWTALGGVPAGFADGTDDGGIVFFNGSAVLYPNLSTQFEIQSGSTTNAALSRTLRTTNYTAIGQPIYLGTGTNVTIDPLIANWAWAPSTNCRFNFATNSITDTNKVYVVNIDIEAGANQQVTNVVDTLTGEGNWGLLTAGLNTVTLTWKAGRWFVTQNTAKIPISQIGGGGSALAISDGGTGSTNAYGALDALNQTAEASVASASTTDLGAVASQKVQITGTTTITSFGTAAAGTKREGRFAGALTLTHNATSLILPSGASITTAANDRFSAYSLGSGNWFVVFYMKADGTAIVGGGGGVALSDSPTWTGNHIFAPSSGIPIVLRPPTDSKMLFSSNYYSVTGSGTNGMIDISGTLNTSGLVDVVRVAITDTASSASSHLLWLGMANGTYEFTVSKSGLVVANSSILSAGNNTGAGSLTANGLICVGRGGLNSTADGTFRLYDNAGTGFTSLSLGPTDSSPNTGAIFGSGASGTDTAGGRVNIGGGPSTGTGKGGAVVIQTTPAATSTGSGANAQVERLIVAPEITLTDAATSVFEIALPTLRTAGGVIRWTIEAGDGTDVQSYSGVTVYSVVNKGGTYTKTYSTAGTANEAKSVSAGTLTATWAFLDGSNKVTMQVTPSGSLTETYYKIFFTIENNSRQAITLL